MRQYYAAERSEEDQAMFPVRDDFGQPVSERGYRFVEVSFQRADPCNGYGHPCFFVEAWSDYWGNRRSNPRYWHFPTRAAAEAFAATVPAYEQ